MTTPCKQSCKFCERPAAKRGMCRRHYNRYNEGWRGARLASPLRTHPATDFSSTNSAVPTTVSENVQIAYLRKANKTLESRLSILAEALGSRHEMAEDVKAAITAAQPFPRHEWTKCDNLGSPVIPVVCFSDWHIGERISKAETEGFGAYSWSIAQKRLHGIVDAFLNWIDTLRYGYAIEECVVFGEGDYISGDIHRELSVTNEFPVPVQTAKAGLLLGETISNLASHFDKVTLYQVGADNHGRLEHRPQFKQKFQNSLSYLVHTIAETYLARHTNIKTVSTVGMKYIAEVVGWRFLVEHGDNTKSWMGIPYYGLERSRAREATRRMNTDRTFHYQSIGHWHVPGLVSGNIIVNGSLSGTSEFDHGLGRHAEPAQVAFLVHPRHGVFNFVPFRGY